MEIKPGDVFRFSWSEAERKRRYMPDHCFDGYLLAVQHPSGLTLVDSFWGWPSDGFISDDKTRFSPAEAERLGTLTFYFNRNEVEPMREWEVEYFAAEDVYRVPEQHGCRLHYFKRPDAKRSAARMAEVLRQKIDNARHDAEWAKRTEERLTETLAQVEAGNVEVCF